jgi:hypothetical protein
VSDLAFHDFLSFKCFAFKMNITLPNELNDEVIDPLLGEKIQDLLVDQISRGIFSNMVCIE